MNFHFWILKNSLEIFLMPFHQSSEESDQAALVGNYRCHAPAFLKCADV